MIFILVYLSDICKSGDHVIIFHAQEMPTLPAAPYPCELKPINLQVFLDQLNCDTFINSNQVSYCMYDHDTRCTLKYNI